MAIKLGTENKKQVAIVAVLGIVLVVLAVRTVMSYFGGDENPAAVASSPAVAPTITPQKGTTVANNHPATKVTGPNLDPSLHPELMAAAENLIYTGRGRNIFSSSSTPTIEAPKASARPKVQTPPPPAPVDAGPPKPPPPPPIDLKYFGFVSNRKGVHTAYLINGDDIYKAAEGDVVNKRYRIVKISPANIQVTDLPFNNTQTVPLTQN
jgi:hypothetical protein